MQISIKRLVVEYGRPKRSRLRVLDNISSVIEDGSITVILGPSGCGKSTLLNVLAGLIAPTSGEIVFDKTVLASVGYVFQTPSLIPWRSVLGNALLGIELKQGVTPQAEARARRLLTSYHLGECLDQFPKILSGGMQQRLAMVRAVVAGANVLLLDEPFSDSDYVMRRELQTDLVRAVEEEALTAVFVTHDVEEAVHIGDKVVVLTPCPARVAAEVEIRIPRRERVRDRWVMDRGLSPYMDRIWAAIDSAGGGDTSNQ